MAKSELSPFSTSKNPSTRTEPDPASHIRESLACVERLREQRAKNPQLSARATWVKQFQLRRFQACYADLLTSPVYASTAQFFVTRLYGDATPEQRDAQFARIAPSIAKVFPAQVVQTAVDVARLHALTETLDQNLALASLTLHPLALNADDNSEQACHLYWAAWQKLDCEHLRGEQLHQVLALGHRMGELVKVKGLALALRMMRGPAQVARMGALQNWLEEGFSTFATLHRQPHGTTRFLNSVDERETLFIRLMSASEPTATAKATPSPWLQALMLKAPNQA